AAIMALEGLPLTSSGKVDRQALVSMEPAMIGGGAEYLAPQTVEEELLAGIWAELLGVDRVSVSNNFFLLGGHSLLATQAVSRVRQCLHVELPLRKIFETPTLAELAAVIEFERKGAKELSVPSITSVSRDSKLPLSFAQQRLWFLDRFEPNSPLYNTPSRLRL